jgi:hypothetical protein
MGTPRRPGQAESRRGASRKLPKRPCPLSDLIAGITGKGQLGEVGPLAVLLVSLVSSPAVRGSYTHGDIRECVARALKAARRRSAFEGAAVIADSPRALGSGLTPDALKRTREIYLQLSGPFGSKSHCCEFLASPVRHSPRKTKRSRRVKHKFLARLDF